ncbi:uracil-DNA glycosylase [bacterium]|nr:uracil-DNA glycosylase [bacterium]MBU1633848.1 uracil-DNA glycosylase [bacterium]MBU1872935.1 uracil-DNA glycosylase [bacterium]
MQPSDDLIKDFFLQQAELYTDEFYFEGRPKLVVSESQTPEQNQEEITRWTELEPRVLACQKCVLAEGRTKVVFGTGNRNADLLFVGEAPGEQEDLQGIPFVGRAGQLLDKILAAIQLERKAVYIANILKCRPPQNRTPNSVEIENCEPYLLNQINLIKPAVIVCLGLTAARTLLRVDSNLRDMRGQVYNYHGVDLVVTYHPAALLRNSNLKKFAWEDFQKIQKMYMQKTGG